MTKFRLSSRQVVDISAPTPNAAMLNEANLRDRDHDHILETKIETKAEAEAESFVSRPF